MQRSLLIDGVAGALMFAWSIGRVQGQAEGEKIIFVSAKDAKFSVSPNGASGASMAPIWGDANMGAHGTFTKFVPGFDAGMHTHTNDVWLVVIKGAYLYKDDAGEESGATRHPGFWEFGEVGDPPSLRSGCGCPLS